MSASEPKKTVLNAWHRAHGAKMVEFAGWDMPVQYEAGILQEHLATRKFGGLFDVSHMGRFRIKGREQVAFLQQVFSNNAESLEPWQAQYTLVPNENGGVVDDAYLYRFGESDYLLVVNASNREKDWAHFQKHAKRFPGVTLEDHTERTAMIAFQGALSGRILASLLEEGALPTVRNDLSQVRLLGTSILVGRTGYTGEPVGFELFVPADKGEQIWSGLYEAGKDQGVLPVGLGARDTLRVEANMPLYGHEFGADPDGREFPTFSFPLVGIAMSFSERKGEFVGRRSLAAQFEQVKRLREGYSEHSDILPQHTRCVALLDKGIARQGDEVRIGGRKVGVITSGTMVPYWLFEGEGSTMKITDRTDRRAIALAYVDARLDPEEEVEVLVRGRPLRAQIVRWHGRSDAPPYFRSMPAGLGKPTPQPGLAGCVKRAELLLHRTLENHEWRQRRCINLIPSEMTPSPLVRLLQVSDPVGRYAEHREVLAYFEQEVYYYQGTDFIAWVEERLMAEMAEFLGCPLVESRAVSGQMANMTVFSALVDYKNRLDRRRESGRIRLVFNNHIGNGGHLSAQPMGALRDYVAKDPVTEKYAVVNFPVCRDNRYRIDLEETAKLLDRLDPELVIFGKSMVLHPEPVAEMRQMLEARKKRAFIMYDMAHVLGLIGPHFQQPFKEGADIVTGSTHKTFFGTQRGVIAVNFERNTPKFELWKAIQRRAFPGMVSNHHLGSLVGLLLSVIEMNAFKGEYQPQVIANAKALACALKDEGLDVQGDPSVSYTETHQVIVRVGYARACEIARRLEQNNIIVNYQAIPGDEGFTASSGLRLGVSEMTRFGIKEKDFRAFAPLFAAVVKSGREVAGEVAKFREEFRKMHYCFEEEREMASSREKLLRTF